MRFFARLALAAIAAGLFASTTASATVVNFDDFDASTLPTLSSYAGFDWTNVFAYPKTMAYDAYPLGVVSGPNAAAAASGFTDPTTGAYTPLTASIKSATNFDFVSAYFGAAHLDGLTVTIAGLLDGTQIFSQTLTLNATGALLFIFNFDNINEVDITATNTGTGDPFQCGQSNCSQVTMDDLTFSAATINVPEPGSLVLLAAGLFAIAVTRRRAG